MLDIAASVVESWKLILFGSLLVGAFAVAGTYLSRPVYTARTVFLPPQQPQSSAASALATLGSLAGLGGSVGSRSPAEQHVALLQSTTVADRMIERFGLMQRYEAKLLSDARRALGGRTRISIGKKDGLITLDVDDHDPKAAADMANQYVDELRELTSSLALTEAQQRRVFFEKQLQATRVRLSRAQAELQRSGFNAGALKSEPRAAAESYAQLRARVTEAEVRLRVLKQSLAHTAPEVIQQSALLAALQQQLDRTELPIVERQDADYVSRYREFKYEETLFELFARQFESARIDESREGSLIQVIDAAKPADRRTSPKRAFTGVVTTAVAMFALLVFVLLRESWRHVVNENRDSRALHRLQSAFGRPTTTR